MTKKKRQELVTMLAEEIDVLNASEQIAKRSKRKVDKAILSYHLGMVDGIALALLHAGAIDQKALSEVTRRTNEVRITSKVLG